MNSSVAVVVVVLSKNQHYSLRPASRRRQYYLRGSVVNIDDNEDNDGQFFLSYIVCIVV